MQGSEKGGANVNLDLGPPAVTEIAGNDELS